MRRPARNWLIVAATMLLAATACSGLGAARSSAATPAAATSITVWTAVGVDYDWPKQFLSQFEKQTGITVHYEQYPETSYTDKLQIAQEAKSTSFDVFMNPQSSTSQYLVQHAITPIKPFLDNSALTPAGFDLKDFPAGEVGQCTLNGTLYCLPVQLDGGPILFYNKATFKAAGIMSPPKTWAAVIADAQKLTKSGHTAICMRGSEAAPNGYPVLLMLPYYLPYAKNYKGEYLDASWKPLFNTPQALKWATDYQTLMHNNAPKGVAAYDYTDCQHAFQNGQVAMWWDNASLGPTLYSPSLSKVAASVGSDSLPCPSFNQTCILSAPWGVYVNPNVDPSRQQAGWKFIAWMTSKATQQEALKATKNPDIATRVSTLTSAIKNGAAFKIPADYLAALRYGIQHIETNAIPVTPAFSKIQAQLFVVVSELITAQVTPQAAVQQLQSKMSAVLQQYGLLSS